VREHGAALDFEPLGDDGRDDSGELTATG